MPNQEQKQLYFRSRILVVIYKNFAKDKTVMARNFHAAVSGSALCSLE